MLKNDKELLEKAIKIVTNFQRVSGMDIDKIPIEIDYNFVKDIGNFCKLKKTVIRIVDIETSERRLFGYIRIYKHKIDIGINNDLNRCWTRFVTCKELSHILLSDDKNGYTKDPKNLIDGLYLKLFLDGGGDLTHEHLATVCATEILMPYQLSQPMLKDSYITSIDIAQKFMIPLYIVHIYRKEEFMKMREEIYSSLF